ncbi:MAG: 1-acyl-sn-glycerol-3-phosphate acyltransferase [Chloroflexi bacterium]|nr:1-acyl-sn-glycerol-3-phosphate acyltransferase [Chloroflexota bacterium]
MPPKGPLILVGNHIAIIEVGMMMTYTPYPLEVMAAGDIPLDPRYRWMADLWGFIPIKRGSMDRGGMNMALDVLEQGGVVGLFPEGGIWETTIRQARQGVAWLSSKANAPIVPIGFGGIEGALTKMLRFERPRMTMNIGQPIPPIRTDVPGRARKDVLQEGADFTSCSASPSRSPQTNGVCANNRMSARRSTSRWAEQPRRCRLADP